MLIRHYKYKTVAPVLFLLKKNKIHNSIENIFSLFII
nr:MAG TPA: hypothetical protein [Caudoviricetes sp.]